MGIKAQVRHADLGKDSERQLKSSFCIDIAVTFRITAARSLFDPACDVLPAALGDALRLVVVHNSAAQNRMGSLEMCMRAWQDAGRIESYRVVDIGQHENLDELNLCQVVLEAGVTARLRRHDCFVAVGGERVNKLVSFASTSFRRYTPAVHINCDLPSVVATLRSGSRVVLDDEPI